MDGAEAGTEPERGIAAYRAVLRLPGVAAITTAGFLARIPVSGMAITLTLHVVLTLQLGYSAAGLAGAALTVGKALGAPLLGRLIDRRGLRPVLALSMVVEGAFWAVAPGLPYPALLVGALLNGLLGLPVYSVVLRRSAPWSPPSGGGPRSPSTR